MVLGIVIFNITVLLRVLTMNSSCSGMGLAYKTCFSYCCSVAKSCPTLRGPHGLQHTRPPYPLQSLSLLKFISIESVIPSNHLILCHPLLLPSIFPRIRVFPNESAPLIRWPNCLKNSCVSSHKDEKKQSCLTKKSLSHLVNRPVRSLKITTCVSCVNLTLYGGIVLVS